MVIQRRIAQVVEKHPYVLDNPSRAVMIEEAVRSREALVSANGALATWTPPESTGRSPKDTVLVYSGERVRVLTRFDHYADATNPYMFHCHILEHEDAGMMGQFVVVA